jgi:hypothetical protein
MLEIQVTMTCRLWWGVEGVYSCGIFGGGSSQGDYFPLLHGSVLILLWFDTLWMNVGLTSYAPSLPQELSSIYGLVLLKFVV